MKGDIKHFCFDKDGVIIDANTYWVYSTKLRALFLKKIFKLSNLDEEHLIEAMGIDLSLDKVKLNGPIGFEPRVKIIKTIKNTLTSLGVKSSIKKISNVLFSVDEHQQNKNDYKIILLDGVREFLDELYMRNYIMTIYTSDRKINTLKTFKTLKIDRFFNQIIGGDSVSKPKPNPEGIHRCCSITGIKERHTAYITDTPSDLMMAKRANISIKIGVLTGLGNQKNLEFESDILCKNLQELYSYL